MTAAAPLPALPARRILSPRQKNGWLGSDYTINLYRGCPHGCIYCDSRSDCYGIQAFDQVHTKQDALALLESDLRRTRRSGVVLTGSMSDPYNPFEPAERLTHGALGLLARHGFGVAVITKSDLVLNDLGLLMRLAEGPGAAVFFTLTSLDEALCRAVEPAAPPPARRLAALRELALAGVNCGVLLTPILPFLEDTPQNVAAILQAAADAGARMAYAGGPGNFGVTQRAGQREYFYAGLEAAFPGMAGRYRAAFGGRYFCPSPAARQLEDAFKAVCRQRGLVYTAAGIAALVHGAQPEQLSF